MDAKISALPAATTPLGGTEEIAIVQAGQTRRVAVSELGGGGLRKSAGVTENGSFSNAGGEAINGAGLTANDHSLIIGFGDGANASGGASDQSIVACRSVNASGVVAAVTASGTSIAACNAVTTGPGMQAVASLASDGGLFAANMVDSVLLATGLNGSVMAAHVVNTPGLIISNNQEGCVLAIRAENLTPGQEGVTLDDIAGCLVVGNMLGGVNDQANLFVEGRGHFCVVDLDDDDVRCGFDASHRSCFTFGHVAGALGRIGAEGINVVQFFRGENAQNESLQFGKIGLNGGFRFNTDKTVGASCGEFWTDGTDVFCFTGGVVKNLTSI